MIKAVAQSFALFVAFAPFGFAQRRDSPLQQVSVPHSYYWREMYVPQVTSGPSSFTWSPDGKEVIYSMQGSLWRQGVDSITPTRLTNGTTYDFQPDWSLDGKSIVYSAYDGRSYALRLLDLGSGATRTLVDNGAVNVEPKWSPDGSRVAFVSSAFNGRWHIFIAQNDSVTRITEDRDSGLPRYYYSRFDHYLSPTWSPDGKELIFVSNRGRIYGTGGLWRMEARAGTIPREIHYEETTWKARPDWAPDGKRVVYSSYHGRQWNQLWVTTSERGDPMPLTYGDFDATSPRWSPDGSRIGYISNEGGNTSLWIVTVPGGERFGVNTGLFTPNPPPASLSILVVDSATGQRIPARISVRDSTGKFYAPKHAWQHSDEAVVRPEQRFEYGYWHSDTNESRLTVPGSVTVDVWHGPEWTTAHREVSSPSARVRIALSRLADLPSRGWWGGDVHVHMNYGGTYRNAPENLARQARAEGLHVVENLVVNKEQRIPDIGYWKGSLLYYSPDLVVANGQEFHTGVWGHASLLGLRNYLLPDYAGYPGTAFASLFPTNAAVFDMAHAQGALTGYVHPFDFRPDISQLQSGVPYELPVDVALGKVDFLEVMGYSDHLITSEIWYRLLNCGFRIPAAAGTDAFPNFAQLRGPPGLVRVYAKSGAALQHRSWLDAIKRGRTFVTNAPLLSFTLDGREPGDSMQLTGKRNARAHVTLKSNVPIDHMELVSNGQVVARLVTESLEPKALSLDTTFSVPIDRTGWYVVRAYADKPRLPVLDLYPFASTSPIYVQVGDAPQRSPEDAEYFIKWIDLLTERVRADTSWNTATEREQALSTIARARAEFTRRASLD
jgi:hypothetical protein